MAIQENQFIRPLWPAFTLIKEEFSDFLGLDMEQDDEVEELFETSEFDDVDFVDMAVDDGEQVPVPIIVQELSRRRVAARGLQKDSIPKTGKIFLINQANGASISIGVMLLDKLAGHIWSGFVVAPDTDYAGSWDVLLEQGTDEPFDPLAGMVQTWNCVRVDVQQIDRVIAQLNDERVQAIRAVRNEYTSGEHNVARECVHPGKVALRVVNDFDVLTGSYLGEADPRKEYRKLYKSVGEKICAPWGAVFKAYLAAKVGLPVDAAKAAFASTWEIWVNAIDDMEHASKVAAYGTLSDKTEQSYEVNDYFNMQELLIEEIDGCILAEIRLHYLNKAKPMVVKLKEKNLPNPIQTEALSANSLEVSFAIPADELSNHLIEVCDELTGEIIKTLPL